MSARGQGKSDHECGVRSAERGVDGTGAGVAHSAFPNQLVHHLLHRSRLHPVPAFHAVRRPHPRPQQPEEIVDLGRRADRGAAARGGVLLLDRHRRRDAFDRVHERFRHPFEELLGVSGERLDVASLTLLVQGVEGEGARARARRTGDDRERAPRQLDRDPLQIVLSRVADDHAVGRGRHNLRKYRTGGLADRRTEFPPQSLSGRPPVRPSRPGGGSRRSDSFAAHMPLALTPRLLRRGLELFAVISLAGVVGLLFYGNNFRAFIGTLVGLHWGWLLLGLGLASMDWIGGGTRLWVVVRHVHPGVRLRDMILAGGMSAWAAYLTPFQTGAGPMMMWTMRRGGVRLPEAVTSTFMTFVATVAFFAIAGPLAIYFGAGKSLARHHVVLGITYYDLFRTSLTIFGVLGVVMLE